MPRTAESLRDLARLISVTHASATHAARHLYAERIIEYEAEGGNIMASLDATFAAADELKDCSRRWPPVAWTSARCVDSMRRSSTSARGPRAAPIRRRWPNDSCHSASPEQSKLLLEIGRRTACTISELASSAVHTLPGARRHAVTPTAPSGDFDHRRFSTQNETMDRARSAPPSA